MTRPCIRREHRLCPAVLMVTLLLGLPAAHAQADESASALSRGLYRLVDAAPLASIAPGADVRWRMESALGLGERQQLRLTTSALSLSAPLVGAVPQVDSRATWRYTVLQRPGWAWRVGLTAALGDPEPRFQPVEKHSRFGSYPLLHVAGEASLARRWQMGFDADGLMTARGRAFELGLRVSYLLAPNFAVTGGYRLTDAAGDGEEAYGNGFSNSANVGVRLRF
jgi:hypothetical protein